MQLVLDTNVWIDWLVFDDPAIAPLKSAHREGRITIVIDEACLRELAGVLAYPEFKLDEGQISSHLAETVRCTVSFAAQLWARAVALPRCTDPDDQKFLALAIGASAHWLLTRDNALLRLNRRMEALGCRVGSPGQWFAACENLHSAHVADSSSLTRAVR